MRVEGGPQCSERIVPRRRRFGGVGALQVEAVERGEVVGCKGRRWDHGAAAKAEGSAAARLRKSKATQGEVRRRKARSAYSCFSG